MYSGGCDDSLLLTLAYAQRKQLWHKIILKEKHATEILQLISNILKKILEIEEKKYIAKISTNSVV